MHTYYDDAGNSYRLNVNDPKIKELNLHGYIPDRITLKDENNNKITCNRTGKDYLSGKYFGMSKNRVCVKDSKGNYFSVYKTDPKYISGELKPIWTGWKHKSETIEKIKRIYKENKH